MDVAATERAPLLGSRPNGVAPPDSADDSEIPAEDVKKALRRSLYKWMAFWMFTAAVTIYWVGLAVKSGNGNFDFRNALRKALGGGIAGAASMLASVLLLMPLRTTMNRQYRFGLGFRETFKTLWAQGGVRRFYAGLPAALVQGPLARFGDTFANVGILALLESNPVLNKLPVVGKTFFAAIAAALFRMILVPIDTLKTTCQVEGRGAIQILKTRIGIHGVGSLWYGAFATAAASFVGFYPWFLTYNLLSDNLPPSQSLPQQLGRQAFIGFVASVVSDTCSNSLRVLKTFRQVHRSRVSYSSAAKEILSTEGWQGLFGRGLKTRLLANGLQGLMFSVLWKLLQDMLV